jgi:hypothetical protein
MIVSYRNRVLYDRFIRKLRVNYDASQYTMETGSSESILFFGLENHLGGRESGLRKEFYGLKSHLGMWESGLRGERAMGTQECQGTNESRIEWLSCLIDGL